MKSIKNHGSTVFAIIIFLVAVGIYHFIFSANQTLTTEGETSTNIGNDVIDLYQKIGAVKLDQHLFSTASYRALTDFSVTIPLQPLGRHNPFDILGK
jgi:hypothetical protein